MEAIIISFTLKDQDFYKIEKCLKKLKKEIPNDTIVIHGFMPREEVVQRGFKTNLVDLIEKTFPIRLNLYYKKPLRAQMSELAYLLNAKIYVIGEIKEGVLEEVVLYENKGLEIIKILI